MCLRCDNVKSSTSLIHHHKERRQTSSSWAAASNDHFRCLQCDNMLFCPFTTVFSGLVLYDVRHWTMTRSATVDKRVRPTSSMSREISAATASNSRRPLRLERRDSLPPSCSSTCRFTSMCVNMVKYGIIHHCDAVYFFDTAPFRRATPSV
ncbi:unnamed protein product, partial [Mesorhabditis spiculigera]